MVMRCTNAAPRRIGLRGGFVASVLACGAATFALAAPAFAETLSISATSLVWRGPDPYNDNTDYAQESKGVFVAEKPSGRYFVPVVFPVTTGQHICSFSMVYQDNNQLDTMKARLFRKPYTVGGAVFANPTAVATVNSAGGVVNTVRVATATLAGAPLINVAQAFYYIEIDIPTVNLNVLGFQIVYKPSCA